MHNRDTTLLSMILASIRFGGSCAPGIMDVLVYVVRLPSTRRLQVHVQECDVHVR